MGKGCIRERFIQLTAVNETVAATLTDTVLRELKYLDLSINDCCGQG
jgi:hypothetical protein